MASSSQLAGRVAVVTGGSRGIGAAVATALLAQGSDVVICGRSAASLAQARGWPSAADAGRLDTVEADVGDAGQAQRVIDRAVERFGGLDILVNNAGVGRFGEDLAATSVENWRTVIDTNLNGVFYCCRAAVPALRRRGGGWIINVSSLAGSHPFAGAAAYCASKAAVNALSAALMQEVRHEAIRVSCVAPGSVDTRFTSGPAADTAWKLTADNVAQAVVDLLRHEPRSLPSYLEIRPARPRRK
ncbi:MAG: SDR family NAD(P)-dependent oxidoreductase [Acidobacteria bacterium]|nr:SDR family NAD(P)-dependent oxidoreductase [Acidobacteriota bacterium]